MRKNHPERLNNFNFFNPRTCKGTNINFPNSKTHVCVIKSSSFLFHVLKDELLPFYNTERGRKLLIARHEINDDLSRLDQGTPSLYDGRVDQLERLARDLVNCSNYSKNNKTLEEAIKVRDPNRAEPSTGFWINFNFSSGDNSASHIEQ